MNVNTINIGVLGCASIAERMVIPAIRGLPGLFNLVGIASRSEEKAQDFARKFDLPSVIGYDTLLELTGLQAVYIPLPNSMHTEWVGRALERGLHVLVEKSLACNLADVDHLNKLAVRNGCVLIENFQFRFHRQLAVIRQLVEEGRIGELRCLRSSFGFPPFPDPANIRYKAELGGGALLDAGAYPLKIAQIFLGHDLTVAAANLTMDPARGIDLWGGAYLQQRSGNLFAEVAFGFDHYYQCNLELWGSKGKLYTNRIFTAPAAYNPEIILETTSGTEVIQVEPDHHFQNMLKHFHACISSGEVPQDEIEQNHHQARLIEELKQKATI